MMRVAQINLPLLSLLLIYASGASAQCPDPVDAVRTFPTDGAIAVPLNTVLRAEFPAAQTPMGQPSWIVVNHFGVQIPGVSAWDGDSSFFTPDELDPDATYTAMVTDQNAGRTWDFRFSTRDWRDHTPPTFGGIAGLSWEHWDEDVLLSQCRLWREEWDDEEGGGFVITLDFDAATDDTAEDQLSYYVFQTAGPAVEGGESVVARLPYEEDGVQLFLSEEEGEGRLCYRVEVRDLAGILDGNTRTKCIEPIVDQMFYDACAAAGPPRPAGWAPALLLGVVGLAWLRRRPPSAPR